MIRMSMNELSTYSWTFEQDVSRYLAAGYEGIGVWRPKLTDFGEKEDSSYCENRGLRYRICYGQVVLLAVMALATARALKMQPKPLA